MAGGTTTTANPSKPSSSSSSSHPIKNNSKPPISSTAKSPAAAQHHHHHHHHSQPKPSPRPPNLPPFHPYTDFLPPQPPLPPPSYGFHMLDRRTIVLSEGSVRSYFALPPDYHHHFSPPTLPRPPPLPDLGFHDPLRFDPGVAGKRSRAEEEAVLFDKACKRQQVLQFGNHPDRFPSSASGTATSAAPMRHLEVDPVALKKSFLHFAKVVNENASVKRNYLENGKSGLIKCAACVIRSSKEFADMHSLIMHTYHSDHGDLLVDHLGLHKALCILMGWSFSKSPDNSKSYQLLPAEEAAANQEDLVIWPPVVIIHNTITGKNKEGRTEGVGNKAMDNIIRELGFTGGKSKSLYSRDGHLGITLIKFAGTPSGLKEAMKLADHFEKENHGRKYWARLQPFTLGKDDENNPKLFKVDGKTGEKRRIFYGYVGTVSDIEKLDFESRKKALIESRMEYLSSNFK